MRYALRLNRPFGLNDLNCCLQLGHEANRKVLRQLIEKKLIRPIGKGLQRHHEYVLERKVADYML